MVSLLLYIFAINKLAPDFSYQLPDYPETFVLALAMAFLAVVGDLVESAIKRDAKIKDSASLIPGHGGVLDLADSLFFNLPIFYYYFLFRGFGDSLF